MSINMSINTMMGGIPISKRAVNIIQQSPKLISAVEAYANDINAGNAKAIIVEEISDKSALYEMGLDGISRITVGSNLFPELSTAEDDFFAVSMLAHELGHYAYKEADRARFIDLNRSLQQRIDDDLYHEGEAMLFAWQIDQEIQENGGPPFDFHHQGRRQLLKDEVDAATLEAQDAAKKTAHFQSLTLDKQKDYLETIKPTDEDLIRRFSKLNETACGSGTSTNLATPPLSYREAYTKGAIDRRNSARYMYMLDIVQRIKNETPLTAQIFPDGSWEKTYKDGVYEYGSPQDHVIEWYDGVNAAAIRGTSGGWVLDNNLAPDVKAWNEWQQILSQMPSQPPGCQLNTIPDAEIGNRIAKDNAENVAGVNASFDRVMQDPVGTAGQNTPPSVTQQGSPSSPGTVPVPPKKQGSSLRPQRGTTKPLPVQTAAFSVPPLSGGHSTVTTSLVAARTETPFVPYEPHVSKPGLDHLIREHHRRAWGDYLDKLIAYFRPAGPALRDFPTMPELPAEGKEHQIWREWWKEKFVFGISRAADEDEALGFSVPERPRPPYDPLVDLLQLEQRLEKLEKVWAHPPFRLRDHGDISPLPTTLPCVRAHPYAFERAMDEVMEKTYRRVARNMCPRVI